MFPGAAPLDSMGLTDAGRRRRSGAARGDAERKAPASVSRESATARDGNVIVTPLFTRALRPAAAATPDSLLIHHCGRHPSSFLLLTPPTTPPLRHLLPIPHVLHPTDQSIAAARSWNPIFSRPCVNLTCLSACISCSSIFNTQLALRILSYGGAPVFAHPLP